ncbi:MAG TPA: DUF4097 family beta strand repeat-containing protein [Pyrinomonadaceae bacterium]|jgi:hypothetical protein
MKLKLLAILIFALCVAPCGARAAEGEPVSEQALAADRAVTVMVCTQANVVVRGWDRAEVRARNTSDGRIELRRTDAGNAPATRIEVLSSDDPDTPVRPGECGHADLELDVPRGSTVQLKGRNGDLDVTGVAVVRAETQSGSVDLRDIARGVEVSTANGDVSVERAAGRVRLRTISGEIEVQDARPLEPGDELSAKTTSGDITLEEVRHARVEAQTAAGTVALTGALAAGGLYDLRTTNGDVTLTLPAESSFFVNARVFHGGDIVTDFPVRLVPNAAAQPPPPPQPPNTPGPKGHGPKSHPPQGNVVLGDGTLTGICGKNEKGGATLNLASFSGTVSLRKEQ